MWIALVILIIVLILAVAMTPSPKSAAAPVLSDYSVPTAQEGRDITMIFGTVWIDDPNIVNYGRLTQRPIFADSGK